MKLRFLIRQSYTVLFLSLVLLANLSSSISHRLAWVETRQNGIKRNSLRVGGRQTHRQKSPRIAAHAPCISHAIIRGHRVHGKAYISTLCNFFRSARRSEPFNTCELRPLGPPDYAGSFCLHRSMLALRHAARRLFASLLSMALQALRLCRNGWRHTYRLVVCHFP